MAEEQHEEHARLSDGRENLGESFADPNSLDDGKLGTSFAETNSSAKKHHRPVKDVVASPFRNVKSNKVLYWFLAAVVVVFLIVLLVGWIPRHNRNKETADRSKHETSDAPEVDATRVRRSQSGGGGVTVPGTTSALVEAAVYARASGYLRRRYVDIGDHVRKGQLLAVIDAPDLDQQVDQAREQVRQAESQLAQQVTQLALTKVTTERYRALVEQGCVLAAGW